MHQWAFDRAGHLGQRVLRHKKPQPFGSEVNAHKRLADGDRLYADTVRSICRAGATVRFRGRDTHVQEIKGTWIGDGFSGSLQPVVKGGLGASSFSAEWRNFNPKRIFYSSRFRVCSRYGVDITQMCNLLFDCPLWKHVLQSRS
jgi:hypothetical protein